MLVGAQHRRAARVELLRGGALPHALAVTTRGSKARSKLQTRRFRKMAAARTSTADAVRAVRSTASQSRLVSSVVTASLAHT